LFWWSPKEVRQSHFLLSRNINCQRNSFLLSCSLTHHSHLVKFKVSLNNWKLLQKSLSQGSKTGRGFLSRYNQVPTFLRVHISQIWSYVLCDRIVSSFFSSYFFVYVLLFVLCGMFMHSPVNGLFEYFV
jgi:hypothetical protein